MEKIRMKNKKYILYFFCVVILFSIIYFIIEIATPKIYLNQIEENSYETIFKEVSLVEIGNEDYSYSCVYSKDMKEIVNILEKVKVKIDPITKDKTDVKLNENYIFLRNKDGRYAKIYFDKKLKTIWINAGDKEDFTFLDASIVKGNISFTYKLVNRKLLKSLFEPLNAYDDKTYEKNNYIDGRIIDKNNNEIIIKEERLDTNIFTLEEWKNKTGKEYVIPILNVDVVDKLNLGDKVRIKHNDKLNLQINSNKVEIKEISDFYYLNEFIYIVEYGDSKYYEKNDIRKAMECFFEDTVDDNRIGYSLWYVYYDEKKAKDILDNEEVFKDNKESLEKNCIVCFTGLLSHTFVGDDWKKNSGNIYQYGWAQYTKSDIVYR